MKIQTRIFGEIEIEETKVITMEDGMIGFPDEKKYTLIYDEESGNKSVLWLQSIDNPDLVFPMIEPLVVCQDYNPVIEDELLKQLGAFDDEHMLVLAVLKVPQETEKMSANLKAPVIINGNTCRACQVIMESGDYEVSYPIYDILTKLSEKED